MKRFEVLFSEESLVFLETLDYKAREKILYNIKKAQLLNDKKLFKKLNDEIWEFRTIYNKKHYRIFAFWDKSAGKDVIIIASHGIVKKSSKVPTNEMKKAENIRKRYFNI